jgi:hypothetical protein
MAGVLCRAQSYGYRSGCLVPPAPENIGGPPQALRSRAVSSRHQRQTPGQRHHAIHSRGAMPGCGVVDQVFTITEKLG